MKKLIYVLVIAVGSLGACKPKSNLDSNKEIVSLSDSTFYNSNYLTDTGAVANADEFIATGAVVSGKSTLPVKKSSTRSSASSSSNAGSTSGSGSSGNSGNTGSTGSTGTTAAKKTGISKAAKGAIIGGVGGAAAGGIITRSAKGAGIGAVVGAAGGYIIGRSKDRKDGRVGN